MEPQKLGAIAVVPADVRVPYSRINLKGAPAAVAIYALPFLPEVERAFAEGARNPRSAAFKALMRTIEARYERMVQSDNAELILDTNRGWERELQVMHSRNGFAEGLFDTLVLGFVRAPITRPRPKKSSRPSAAKAPDPPGPDVGRAQRGEGDEYYNLRSGMLRKDKTWHFKRARGKK